MRFTDLYRCADLCIFHIALEYALSIIIFLNTNALFFLMLSQQLVNADAILQEFWFSGSLYPWLVLHSSAEGAKRLSCLTC